MAENLIEKYKYIENSPLEYSFYENFLTAMMGIEKKCYGLAHNVLLQFMTFYCYDELKIIVFTSDQKARKWDYLKYSNYCFNTEKNVRFFATNVEEAKELIKIHPNIVIKIPMCEEGLKATKILSGMGVKTNVRLIFSAAQALLAARAGATYVSPFLGRLDDISQPGIRLIEDIVTIFDNYGLETEIIAASVRNPIHVTDCALAGAHIATVPYGVIETMTKHPLTDQGIAKFQKDYIAVFGE